MRYFVTVNDEEHEVELVDRPGGLEVRYDGEPIETRYEEVDRLGQVALFLGHRSFAISIEGDSAQAMVTVAGHLYDVAIEDERERAAHQAERGRGRRGGEVTSIMPGVVIKVLVAEGETIVAGQALLILEAMKMQNEIAAPAAGKVVRIHVAEGEAVASGATLVTLAGTSDG